MKSYNDMLTLSLLGGANNNNCLLNEKKDNHDIESLSNQTLFIVVFLLEKGIVHLWKERDYLFF